MCLSISHSFLWLIIHCIPHFVYLLQLMSCIVLLWLLGIFLMWPFLSGISFCEDLGFSFFFVYGYEMDVWYSNTVYNCFEETVIMVHCFIIPSSVYRYSELFFLKHPLGIFCVVDTLVNVKWYLTVVLIFHFHSDEW